MKRDFLTGEEFGAFELGKLLDRAAELKAGRRDGVGRDSLAGRSIALVFEKPSTRTRISFDVGVAELGAHGVMLRGDELQLSRGESTGDTARVLSRYVDAIVIRSGSHETVAALAEAAEVPVVNGLTPLHHPCQAIADLLTMRERFGDLHGLRLAYVGDGNNVARSLAILGELAGVEVVVAAPEGYQLEEGHGVKLTGDPRAAADGADALYTDVWVSMGDEEEADRRRADLAPSGSTPTCSPPPRSGRSSSTACPPTPARRSPPRSYMASTPPSGTRPRTGCTRRRRCWSCCSPSSGARPCIPRSTSAR